MRTGDDAATLRMKRFEVCCSKTRYCRAESHITKVRATNYKKKKKKCIDNCCRVLIATFHTEKGRESLLWGKLERAHVTLE